MSGEHYIPFRRNDIVAMCAAELPAAERASFLGFARMLASLLHHQFHARIEALKDAYHPLNSEADTRNVTTLSPEELHAAQLRLEAELEALARAANFTPIDPAELNRAFNDHSLLKVRMAVDTDSIDKVMFFRRGESTRTRRERIWFGLRRRTVTFTNYGRVLVYARFKETEGRTAVIKLFQNVPRHDLEMVFPNVQVRMRPIDRVLIGVPALFSGVVLVVTKLVTSLGLVLLLLAFWMGLRDQPVTLNQTAVISAGIGLGAFGAYLVRQITKFKNRKILFMKALSESLYFRNLDNDAGVFHHLLDAAEEAEATEALLAYHLLRTAPHPLSPKELDSRIESWFAQRWDARLDFEVDDGVRKLRQLSLVTEDEQGRLSAVALTDAKRYLDKVWDDLVNYDEGAELTANAG
ncbi:MAG TPA: TMEM143 family protein [Micromonosporaceae bacterium]|nr:TMEM143 family protein [Micromonosporaceae bacterium]